MPKRHCLAQGQASLSAATTAREASSFKLSGWLAAQFMNTCLARSPESIATFGAQNEKPFIRSAIPET